MRGIVQNQGRDFKNDSKRDLKLVTGIGTLCNGPPECGGTNQFVNKLVLNNLIFYHKIKGRAFVLSFLLNHE
jgi:hypothetical protein